MADIITEVLTKERDAAASIEKARADLTMAFDKERASLDEKSSDRIAQAQQKYAAERAELTEKLHATQAAKEKSLAQSNKKYDKVTDAKIEDVARKVTAALK